MNSYLRYSWIPSLMVIVGLSVMSSCKDDGAKPKNAGISFAVAEEEVTESDGTLDSFHPLLLNGATGREVKVKLTLDKELSEKAIISYTVGGTAKKNTASVIGDYEIKDDPGFITIDPGVTEAYIRFTVFEDGSFEALDDLLPLDSAYETITLTLNSVVSGPAELGEQVDYTMKIMEDDLLTILSWDPGEGKKADMDLILFVEDPPATGDFVDIDSSADTVSIDPGPEILVLPGGFGNGLFGFSYTYYNGNSDSVNFAVDFYSTYGTMKGSFKELTYEGQPLKLANINKYDTEEGIVPIVVQTLEKDEFDYPNITEITRPESGSRIKSFTTRNIESIKKGVNIKSALSPRLIQALKGRSK